MNIQNLSATESVTARAGCDTNSPSEEHSEFFDRPVMESVTAQVGSDTDFPNGKYSKCNDRPVTKAVTARAVDTEKILVMNVSAVATENSELRTIVSGETDQRDIPVYSVECTPESRHPEKISAGALQHVEMSDKQRNYVNYCCNVCGNANSVNRSGTGSCWNCCCLIVGGYRVSCVATIVIKDQLYGINLFTEDRRIGNRGPGLVCNHETPGDVRKMTGNFNCDMNNMLSRSNDLAGRRYRQWRADDGHHSLTHVSLPDKPIRERGRFGCANTPVRDADWLVNNSVGPIPVGEIRINYIRDPADRGQSLYAAPSTGSLLIYTIRRLRHYRAAEYITCWTFCDTVWNSLRIEGFFLRRGAFQACQTMDGAVLMHNCPSVMFHDGLCIPWYAPQVVIDESSTIMFGSVPRPHRVVLLGRDEDVNDRQILADGDSRVVQFRRPELHSANKEYGDVALRDKGEARELPTSAFTIDNSAGKPTLRTEVQSPRYTVSGEATVGDDRTPDCAPALPAHVLEESRADQTWSSSRRPVCRADVRHGP